MTWPRVHLVAADDREVGALPRRALELLAELPVTQVGAGRDPAASQVRHDPESRHRVVGVRAHDHDVGLRRLGQRDPFLGERQDDPVEADPEPDARRRRAAQQLDEPVIAAAAAERLLLALGARAVELEGGPRVVVEAADERRIEGRRDPDRGKMRLHPLEVGRAGVAKELADPRRARDERGHPLILGVEQPERVRGEPLAFGGRQVGLVVAEVRGQPCDVGRAACSVADAVEEHPHVGEARLTEERERQLDDLRVHGGPGIADDLHVELPELAVAPGLRPVVAEHRSGEREADRLRPGAHPVLDPGAHDAGGRLGSQRPTLALCVAASSLDTEELLLDDVGDGADAPLEDFRLLEERRLDGLVSVGRREVARERLEPANAARSSGSRSRVPRGDR